MLTIPILTLISLITFILYASDKRRAKRGKWRIPERVLLGFSLLGGGIGGALAMLLLRHKTKHTYFTVVNVLGIAIQILIVLFSLKIIPLS